MFCVAGDEEGAWDAEAAKDSPLIGGNKGSPAETTNLVALTTHIWRHLAAVLYEGPNHQRLKR